MAFFLLQNLWKLSTIWQLIIKWIYYNFSEETCKYYNSDFTTASDDYKDFLKKYFLAQIDGFEYGVTGVGW